MGVIKLSGWTHCTTLNCEHGSNKTHSSVSYNTFTLRALLLPCSQFSVVQYVHPASFITPRFTVRCYWFFAALSTISALSCNNGEGTYNELPPMFTVQCRTICSPWEFYYSHVHSSVSYNMFMGVIKLSGWTYCTTLNCEHGSNKTIRMIILYDTELWTWE
jgi:hypothetical protein